MNRKTRRGGLRRMLAGILAAAMLLSLLCGCAKKPETGVNKTGRNDAPAAISGFASGEDVLLHALSAIRDFDPDRLAACYAFDLLTDRVRFDSLYGPLHLDYDCLAIEWNWLPEDTDFGRTWNRYHQLTRAWIDAAVPFFAAANGCFADRLRNPYAREYLRIQGWDRKTESAPEAEAFLAALRSEETARVLGTIRLTGPVFDAVEAKRAQYSEETLALRAALACADRLVEYAAPVNVDGFDCLFSVTAAQIDGRWYLNRLGGLVSSSFGNQIGGFCASYLSEDALPQGEPPALPAAEPGRTAPQPIRSGGGFDSPEAAAQAYARALQNLDLQAALKSYAVDLFVGENLEVYICTVLEPDKTPIGGGTALEQSAKAVFEKNCLNHFLRCYLTVLGGMSGDFGRTSWTNGLEGLDRTGNRIRSSGAEDPQRIAAALHNRLNDAQTRDALRNMTILETKTDRNEWLEQFRVRYGVSDYAATRMTVQIGGQSYILHVESVCTDGKWYNVPALTPYVEQTSLPVLFN